MSFTFKLCRVRKHWQPPLAQTTQQKWLPHYKENKHRTNKPDKSVPIHWFFKKKSELFLFSFLSLITLISSQSHYIDSYMYTSVTNTIILPILPSICVCLRILTHMCTRQDTHAYTITIIIIFQYYSETYFFFRMRQQVCRVRNAVPASLASVVASRSACCLDVPCYCRCICRLCSIALLLLSLALWCVTKWCVIHIYYTYMHIYIGPMEPNVGSHICTYTHHCIMGHGLSTFRWFGNFGKSAWPLGHS